MIDWTRATGDEVLAINAIAKRAVSVEPTLDLLSTQMDLEACHTHGCPLDLDRMAAASLGDLMHDIYGLRRHLSRDNGQLMDGFVPRFAK